MRINVTRIIKLPEFKGTIKDIVIKPKLPYEKPKILYPRICLSREAPQVGTAYDYMMRYFLIKKYPKLILSSGWVWELVARKFYVEQEILEIKNILNTNGITNKKLETLILISNLDVIFRTGSRQYFTRNPKLTDNINDLKQLTNTLNNLPFVPKTKMHLNLALLIGNLNEPNHLFGDIDLIIDDILIDIKTTQEIEFTDSMWYQLILYYYMLKFTDCKINKVGIYYSRYNYLFEIDIRNFINDFQLNEIEELIFKIIKADDKWKLKNKKLN